MPIGFCMAGEKFREQIQAAYLMESVSKNGWRQLFLKPRNQVTIVSPQIRLAGFFPIRHPTRMGCGFTAMWPKRSTQRMPTKCDLGSLANGSIGVVCMVFLLGTKSGNWLLISHKRQMHWKKEVINVLQLPFVN